MSIATEITRLQNAKASIKSSIENKGVSVSPSATLDGYSILIDAISSGGGSGLEYETGTYTPSEDVSRPSINFAKTHSKPPCFVSMYDCTGTIDETTYTNVAFNFIDIYQLFNGSYTYSSSVTNPMSCGTAIFIYRGTSLGSLSALSTGAQHVAYNYTNTGSDSGTYSRYWTDESSFRPYCGSALRYWRTTRTYKWVAIWK